MTTMLFSALFVTYDGLLDPLGGSQILPYLRSIAAHPRRLHIISFEKSHRYISGCKDMRNQLARSGISWTPLKFTDRFGLIGKLWDLIRMYLTCLILQWRYGFEVIHCRSYQAMQVGCLLNHLTGVKTIFDMRGLWVDDRIDGGLWPRDSFIYRLIYRIYKRIERKLLECASHVVVLTNRVVPEIRKIAPQMTAGITVIPCCADYDHFTPLPNLDRVKIRAGLGVGPQDVILAYLGSIGTLYLLNEMLCFFHRVAKKRDDVHFLVITHDWREEHETLVRELGIGHLRDRIIVKTATRDEVPLILGISDIMLSFRKSTYSQIASSPTKLAEAFSLGVPVISNSRVGDVDLLTQTLDAGAVVDLMDDQSIAQVADNLDYICRKGGRALRERTRPTLGLEVAVCAYRSVYRSIEEHDCKPSLL